MKNYYFWSKTRKKIWVEPYYQIGSCAFLVRIPDTDFETNATFRLNTPLLRKVGQKRPVFEIKGIPYR